jgi:ribonucleoside-diphosphate reductase subunit M1
MAGDRQRFVDQSQSMNIYLTNPSIELLTKIHFYGWKKELKTGCYYIRSRSLTASQNFFIDAKKEQELQECENCSA